MFHVKHSKGGDDGMSFWEHEEMQSHLNELGNPETSSERRSEIILAIGRQHVSGMDEYSTHKSTHEKILEELQDSKLTVANLYAQTTSELFKGVEGVVEEPNVMETVTFDDLLRN